MANYACVKYKHYFSIVLSSFGYIMFHKAIKLLIIFFIKLI